MRDLTRAREDLKAAERIACQRLSAFLLRHGQTYQGKTRWTQAHFRWLERVTLATPVQQIVFTEYVDCVKEAKRRVAGLVEQIAWPWSTGRYGRWSRR